MAFSFSARTLAASASGAARHTPHTCTGYLEVWGFLFLRGQFPPTSGRSQNHLKWPHGVVVPGSLPEALNARRAMFKRGSPSAERGGEHRDQGSGGLAGMQRTDEGLQKRTGRSDQAEGKLTNSLPQSVKLALGTPCPPPFVGANPSPKKANPPRAGSKHLKAQVQCSPSPSFQASATSRSFSALASLARATSSLVFSSALVMVYSHLLNICISGHALGG